jgi:hypothetical protein
MADGYFDQDGQNTHLGVRDIELANYERAPLMESGK